MGRCFLSNPRFHLTPDIGDHLDHYLTVPISADKNILRILAVADFFFDMPLFTK